MDGEEEGEAVGDKEDPGDKKGSETFVDSQLKAIRVKEGTSKRKAKEGLSERRAEGGTSKGEAKEVDKPIVITDGKEEEGAVGDKEVPGNQKSYKGAVNSQPKATRAKEAKGLIPLDNHTCASSSIFFTRVLKS